MDSQQLNWALGCLQPLRTLISRIVSYNLVSMLCYVVVAAAVVVVVVVVAIIAAIIAIIAIIAVIIASVYYTKSYVCAKSSPSLSPSPLAMHKCFANACAGPLCKDAIFLGFVSLFVLVDWRLVSLSCWVWLCFGGVVSPMFVTGRHHQSERARTARGQAISADRFRAGVPAAPDFF
jgi:hypothetical protein